MRRLFQGGFLFLPPYLLVVPSAAHRNSVSAKRGLGLLTVRGPDNEAFNQIIFRLQVLRPTKRE